MLDRAIDHELGLRTLRAKLPQNDTNSRGRLSALEARLRDNLVSKSKYGPTPINQADYAHIIENLDRLSEEKLGVSYAKLCSSPQIQIPLPPSWWKRHSKVFIIACVITVCIVLLAFVFINIIWPYIHKKSLSQIYPCEFVQAQSAIVNGLGAEPWDNACVGISDGTVTAFDMSLNLTGKLPARTSQQMQSTYVALKTSVIQDLHDGKYDDAYNAYLEQFATWDKSAPLATYDPETLIYLNNAEIMRDHPTSYVTLVITTAFPSNPGGSRDLLQGIYILQNEALRQSICITASCPQLRVLIANVGADPADAARVSEQIVIVSKNDKTFKGVIGWSLRSAYEENALGILEQSHIPMISPTISDDQLTSPFLFHIAATNAQQAQIAANYAAKNHTYQRIVVLYDRDDAAYSANLAQDFKTYSQKVVDAIQYTEGNAALIQSAVATALRQDDNPDTIYFAGYSYDLGALLKALPCNTTYCPKVLGGDALYVLGNYNQFAKANYNRLRFTAFASPDEWSFANSQVKLSEPPNSTFVEDYQNAFDPQTLDPRQALLGTYGWGRFDADVMLSFDAASVAIYAYGQTVGNVNLSLEQALTTIKGANACEGLTGLFDFQDGQVPHKAVVMLAVSSGGYTHPVSISDRSQLSMTQHLCSHR